VVKVAEESFVEKMLYRMVKKHIAGTTMSAALSKVEELNGRNIPASITFLSSDVDNKSKARYVTITYLELIRRIARLGLKASVHIPSSQLGMMIDQDTALKNIGEVIGTGNKYGVFVWIEANEPEAQLFGRFDGTRGYGLAFHEQSTKKFNPVYKRLKSAKVLFSEEKGPKQQHKEPGIKDIEGVLKSSNNIVLSSPPDGMVRVLSNGSKYKSRVVLEFKLGYSSKRLSSLTKKVSVSVPFGKDWINFATNSVPEGYMRFLASNLLKERHVPEV